MLLSQMQKTRSPRCVSRRQDVIRALLLTVLLLLGDGRDQLGLTASEGPPKIVVLLRDRLSEDDERSRLPLSTDEIELLSAAAGLPLEPISQTRDGAQVLRLPAVASGEGVDEVLGALRMLPEMLWAERYSGVARSVLRTDLPPLTQIMVKLQHPAMRERSDANGTLHKPMLSALSTLAGVELTFVRAMAGGAFVLGLPEPRPPSEVEKICARLEADARVIWADPDAAVKSTGWPSDARYIWQWHYYEPVGGIRAPEAWSVTTGNEAIRVAVLDTGIRFGHPDLLGRTYPGYDMISDAFNANDGNGRDFDASDPGDWTPTNACGVGEGPTDSSWHGTHVAGTIGAHSDNGIGVGGVNWVSRIVPVRVIGRCGGSTADIADGIRWAAGLAVPGLARNPTPARILNLSLGGSGLCSSAFQSAIDWAILAGAVVVVAAGNEGRDAAQSQPGNCRGVVTVAATSRSGGQTAYSNNGSVVEISAPGGDGHPGFPHNGVLSTSNTGLRGPADHSYEYSSGTSMAAPHVAGVASLILSVNPALTPAQVGQVLQSTARTFPNTGNFFGCNRTLCGSGIVNAYAAVAAATATSCRDPYEPNNFAQQGPLLEIGRTYDGRICASTDEAWFRLAMPRVGTLSLSLTVPVSTNYNLELYGPSGEWVASSLLGQGLTENIIYRTRRAGTYLVRVRGHNGSFTPWGTYGLTRQW